MFFHSDVLKLIAHNKINPFHNLFKPFLLLYPGSTLELIQNRKEEITQIIEGDNNKYVPGSSPYPNCLCCWSWAWCGNHLTTSLLNDSNLQASLNSGLPIVWITEFATNPSKNSIAYVAIFLSDGFPIFGPP